MKTTTIKILKISRQRFIGALICTLIVVSFGLYISCSDGNNTIPEQKAENIWAIKDPSMKKAVDYDSKKYGEALSESIGIFHQNKMKSGTDLETIFLDKLQAKIDEPMTSLLMDEIPEKDKPIINDARSVEYLQKLKEKLASIQDTKDASIVMTQEEYLKKCSTAFDQFAGSVNNDANFADSEKQGIIIFCRAQYERMTTEMSNFDSYASATEESPNGWWARHLNRINSLYEIKDINLQCSGNVSDLNQAVLILFCGLKTTQTVGAWQNY